MAEIGKNEVMSRAQMNVDSLKSLLLEQKNLLKQNQDEDATSNEVDLISKNIEMIDLGLAESNVLCLLAQHSRCVQAEMQKLKDSAKKLDQENAFLNDELLRTQQKLQESEASVAQLREDISQLMFTNNEAENNEVSNTSGSSYSDEEFPELSDAAVHLVREATVGCNLPYDYNKFCNLVTILGIEKKFEDAISSCKENIQDLEIAVGHYHPDVASLRNILAILYRDRQLYSEAEDEFKFVLRIREKTLGTDHPAVATTLNYLATVVEKQGRLEEAEKLRKKYRNLKEPRLSVDMEKSPSKSQNWIMNSLSPRKPLQIITNVIGTQIHRLSTSLSPNKNLK